MEKEIKITPPEGFEIDKENSTFDCIKFKSVVKRWRDNNSFVKGYCVEGNNIVKYDVYNRFDKGNHDIYATEKQGENKPTENIEIKFCEGDKIVSSQNGKVYTVGTAYYVTGEGEDICLHDTDGNHLWTNRNDLDKNYHLWTIEDAKEGDVLNSPSHRLIWIYKDNEHYHVCVNMNYVTKNIATDGLIKIPSDAYPATKDERTILFEKMKEAGYEWDANKKELRKVEAKTLDPNKVIAWLVDNICDFEHYVKLFKKDFELC